MTHPPAVFAGAGLLFVLVCAGTGFMIADIGWKETAMVWGLTFAILGTITAGVLLIAWGMS